MSERTTAAPGAPTPLQTSMRADGMKMLKTSGLALTITTVAAPVLVGGGLYYIRKSQEPGAETRATTGESNKAITTSTLMLTGALATTVVGNVFSLMQLRQATKKLE